MDSRKEDHIFIKKEIVEKRTKYNLETLLFADYENALGCTLRGKLWRSVEITRFPANLLELLNIYTYQLI
jgi:hypothetical protein